MNPHRGAYVYIGSRGDATLVMYRRLATMYMLVAYRRRRECCMLVSFDDILGVVPIHAMPLEGVALRLLSSVDATVASWLTEAFACLSRGAEERTEPPPPPHGKKCRVQTAS